MLVLKNNQKGFGLIGQVMLIGMVIGLSMGSSLLIVHSPQDSQHENNRISLYTIQKSLVAIMQNKDAFNFTRLANPSSFSCIESAQKCNSERFYPLEIIRDAADEDYYNSNQSHGFNNYGKRCVFDQGNPEACPFYIEASWSPICSETTKCSIPDGYRVKFDMLMRDSSSMSGKLNLANYSEEFAQDGFTDGSSSEENF